MTSIDVVPNVVNSDANAGVRLQTVAEPGSLGVPDKLHLAKLYLANFFWRALFSRTSVGVDWPILSMASLNM